MNLIWCRKLHILKMQISVIFANNLHFIGFRKVVQINNLVKYLG